MKKILFISTLTLGFVLQSCNDSAAGQIEMVTPLQVYEAVHSEENMQLVDVRTEEEYQVSHLQNAQNICVTSDDFKEKVASLDKKKPVYVYCRSGKRSSRAAKILIDMGFTKVYDLQGGHQSWAKEGLESIE
jgi:rhodanese-related sulfurtransferase